MNGLSGAKVRRAFYGRSSVMTAADLTDRQREILSLAAEGLNNDAIGQRLFISTATVKNHLNVIYQRLGIEAEQGQIARVLAVRKFFESYPMGGAG